MSECHMGWRTYWQSAPWCHLEMKSTDLVTWQNWRRGHWKAAWMRRPWYTTLGKSCFVGTVSHLQWKEQTAIHLLWEPEVWLHDFLSCFSLTGTARSEGLFSPIWISDSMTSLSSMPLQKQNMVISKETHQWSSSDITGQFFSPVSFREPWLALIIQVWAKTLD